MKDKIVTLHNDDGIRTALVVSVGPKFYGMIWPDSSGVKIKKIPKATARFTEIPYNLNRAKRHLRRCVASLPLPRKAGRSRFRRAAPQRVRQP